MLTLWDLLKPIREAEASGGPADGPGGRTRCATPSAPSAGGQPRAGRREGSGQGSWPGPARGAGGGLHAGEVRRDGARDAGQVRDQDPQVAGFVGDRAADEYADGTRTRTLESPRPTRPDVGGDLPARGGAPRHPGPSTVCVRKPRCLEEYHAWAFAIREMERLGLNVTDSVRLRMHRSLKYAIDKARRRGLVELPAELGALRHAAPQAGGAEAPGREVVPSSGPGGAQPGGLRYSLGASNSRSLYAHPA